MERSVLIDSNVYIDLMRQRLDPTRELLRRFGLTDVACCGIVKAEVLRGVKSPRARDRLLAFFDLTEMVPTTARLWDEIWSLAWKLDRQGKVLPITDIVIAASAVRIQAAVMTRDRHFREIPELHVIEP